MDRNTVRRIFALQDMAMEDERYRQLLAEYRLLDKGLLDVFAAVTPAQRDAVMDYVGCVHAINLRLLELACVSDEKS